jgi:hypothetical protein
VHWLPHSVVHIMDWHVLGDHPGPNLKVLVTNVDSGPGGHVGNSRDRELME